MTDDEALIQKAVAAAIQSFRVHDAVGQVWEPSRFQLMIMEATIHAAAPIFREAYEETVRKKCMELPLNTRVLVREAYQQGREDAAKDIEAYGQRDVEDCGCCGIDWDAPTFARIARGDGDDELSI